jgi:hypothetical protein
MSEKVIIPDTVTPAEEEVEYDGEILLSTSHDYITSAVNAINVIADMDTAIMTKSDESRIKKIKRQSLRILSHYINEIYEETFDDSSNNNDE